MPDDRPERLLDAVGEANGTAHGAGSHRSERQDAGILLAAECAPDEGDDDPNGRFGQAEQVGEQARHQERVLVRRMHRQATGGRNRHGDLVLDRVVVDRRDTVRVLENPVRYAYRLKVPRFGLMDGESMQVAPSVLSDLVRSMARAPQREQPLDLGSPNTYIEERTFSAPKGLAFRAVPKDSEVDSDFGRLRLQYVLEGNTLKVRTEFVLKEARIKPAAYAAFRSWVDAADQLLRQRIVLARGAS